MASEEELMEDMAEDKVPQPVATGLDSAELKEFIAYIQGDSAEPPEVMNKIMNNLINKLSMGLGYNVVSNISRQTKLAKFLAVAEDRIFDLDEVKVMDRSELMELYKSAGRTLTDLFEVQRKFIIQNRDSFKTESTTQEKMVSKLLALPPEKLDKIMAMIDGKDEEDPTEGFEEA